MHPWIPVIVTVCLGLVGLAIQAAAFAFFMGRFRAEASFTRELVGTLLKRDDKARDDEITRAESRGQLIARLGAVEKNTEVLGEMERGIATLAQRVETIDERTESFQASTGRQMDALQRQISALVTGSGGAVIRIEKQGDGRP